VIQQAICTIFYTDLYSGVHNLLAGDVIRLALYGQAADLDASTAAYTASGEITGDAYTAGGIDLTGATLVLDGGVARIRWANAQWPAGVLSARGGLIYNASKSNKAIAVLDFGHTKTMNPFVVVT